MDGPHQRGGLYRCLEDRTEGLPQEADSKEAATMKAASLHCLHCRCDYESGSLGNGYDDTNLALKQRVPPPVTATCPMHDGLFPQITCSDQHDAFSPVSKQLMQSELQIRRSHTNTFRQEMHELTGGTTFVNHTTGK
jgi:hypothetical protein